ncbi:MAG TPA: HD domain-containing protein [Chitinispirillaceae bacterium]|jgi:putative two-component system response regulator|nr:HD domain-containing protein [Chitinispirillaceae bacterium]
MDDIAYSSEELLRLNALYMKEKQKRIDLEKRLKKSRTQLKVCRDKLSLLRKRSAENRKALTITNEQLEKYASDLRTIVESLNKTNRDLQNAYQDTIHRLVLASEYKDNETGNHIHRMSRYCAKVAEKLNFSKEEVEHIRFATPMHDVGKIGIPDRIILKNGRLTRKEFEIVKKHTIIGAEILQNSKARILKLARDIALYHHEKWDGTGYPEGLKGEAIPVHARIVALCDIFDALTSKRPYKSSYPVDVSCEIIKKGKGTHFDPALTDIFLSSIDELVSIKNEIDLPSRAIAVAAYTWSERDLIDAVR